ncbi:MAG: sugar-binding domain-containing protein [Motiliproteus sp.]
MPAKNTLKENELTQQAAYLRGQHKMDQNAISKLLGISQPHVSRLLKRAGEKGWLYTEQRFIDKGISAKELAQIKRLLIPGSLTEKLNTLAQNSGVATPNIRVFDSGAKAFTPEILQRRRIQLGRVAAGRLDELLSTSKIVGVTWGKMVNAIIEGLFNLNLKSTGKEPTRFVPVCAELTSHTARDYSSTRLAERMDEIVNDSSNYHLSLRGVPAYVPLKFEATKEQAIWEYVSETASHKLIFSGPHALTSQMDTILTSVGSSENPVGGALDELAKAGGVTKNTLQKLIVGDIGGILIPHPNISHKERLRIGALNKMWTGMTLDQLHNIASRFVSDNAGSGSIVVALGSERALIVHEIIRLGLVNELIIDEDLANALETM